MFEAFSCSTIFLSLWRCLMEVSCLVSQEAGLRENSLAL